MEIKNILLIGVGGQGTILTSKILAKAIMEKGLDVKMSEIHGMSQRGGTVTTQIRYGKKVSSPVIEEGCADIIVSFEKCEALRCLSSLKKGGALIVNNYELQPVTVAIGAAEYPKDIIAEYKNKVENTYVIDAFGIAESLGNAKCMNIALLGALAKRLGLDGTDWERLIREEVPRKAEELNISAFKRGFEMG
ncbi:indolepyruvate oxidoreductase subunit beta [Anaerotignum faecicola]|nr:indolepyruvate oxidoreductase subunit beta [Anaerotignum faecicola]